MIGEPEIVATAAQPAAVIHLTIPAAGMRTEFGPAVGELMAALAAQGVAPAGPVFAHHLKPPGDIFDFELGVAVGGPVAPQGRVRPGSLPAARVARATHGGSYEGLQASWGALMDWVAARGQHPAENLWEVYAAGPADSPDPADWRTELNRPLRD
jgi:effector-binding domain-containing protein